MIMSIDMDKVTSEVVKVALNAKGGLFAKKPALSALLTQHKLATDGIRTVMVDRVIEFFDHSRGRQRTEFLKKLGPGLSAAVKAAASDSEEEDANESPEVPKGGKGGKGKKGAKRMDADGTSEESMSDDGGATTRKRSHGVANKKGAANKPPKHAYLAIGDVKVGTKLVAPGGAANIVVMTVTKVGNGKVTAKDSNGCTTEGPLKPVVGRHNDTLMLATLQNGELDMLGEDQALACGVLLAHQPAGGGDAVRRRVVFVGLAAAAPATVLDALKAARANHADVHVVTAAMPSAMLSTPAGMLTDLRVTTPAAAEKAHFKTMGRIKEKVIAFADDDGDGDQGGGKRRKTDTSGTSEGDDDDAMGGGESSDEGGAKEEAISAAKALMARREAAKLKARGAGVGADLAEALSIGATGTKLDATRTAAAAVRKASALSAVIAAKHMGSGTTIAEAAVLHIMYFGDSALLPAASASMKGGLLKYISVAATNHVLRAVDKLGVLQEVFADLHPGIPFGEIAREFREMAQLEANANVGGSITHAERCMEETIAALLAWTAAQVGTALSEGGSVAATDVAAEWRRQTTRATNHHAARPSLWATTRPPFHQKERVPQPPGSAALAQEPCRDFGNGKCTRGNACRYSHAKKVPTGVPTAH